MFEREQQREGGVRAAEGVGDARRRFGPAVGKARDPGDPRLRFDRRRVREALAPRAGDPVAGRAQHDQARVARQQHVLVEAQLLEDPGAEVVDHDVAHRGEIEEQLAAALGVELHREVELVGVRTLEHGAPLPPPRLAHRTGRVAADAVGLLGRLHVDHLGAEDGAGVADEWSGPERGDVERRGSRQVGGGRRRRLPLPSRPLPTTSRCAPDATRCRVRSPAPHAKGRGVAPPPRRYGTAGCDHPVRRWR